jgi:hypothetical protein
VIEQLALIICITLVLGSYLVPFSVYSIWGFPWFILVYPCKIGAWGSVVVKALRYYLDGPRIDSRRCHWMFQWHISLRPYHGPGVDSARSENEYQEHFLGVMVAGAWGWRPHHLHMQNVMEIWEPKPPGTSWNPLGHTRPVTGSLYLYLFIIYCMLIVSWVWNWK